MLARKVSRRCKECDRRLHRLVSYMNCTQAWAQHSYVGDVFDDIRLGLFTDADFAGDKSDSKSASGFFIAAIGPHTYASIVSTSKKQGCVSTSTCESEVVAMNLGLKEAMSILDLWQALETVFSRSGGSSAGAAADAGGVRHNETSWLVCREGSRPEKGFVGTIYTPSTSFGLRR